MTVMSPTTQTHIVTNLKKYTKYEFFIAPFYRSVEGQPSNSKIVQTFEDGKCFPFKGSFTISNYNLLASVESIILIWHYDGLFLYLNELQFHQPHQITLKLEC